MSQLLDRLREDFQEEKARYAYVEAHLNASVAAQIKKFRGEMSQQELAEKIGTKQSGISRLENANYSSWKVETLRKLARAFGLRLSITFEEFGTLIPEIENFKKVILERRSFEKDPVFNEQVDEPQKDAAATAQIGAIQHVANAEVGSDLSWQGNSFDMAKELAATSYDQYRRLTSACISEQRAIPQSMQASSPAPVIPIRSSDDPYCRLSIVPKPSSNVVNPGAVDAA